MIVVVYIKIMVNTFTGHFYETGIMTDIGTQIQVLYQSGYTQKQVASIVGCSLTTVRRRMGQLGIVGRSNGSRKYQLREDVFDEIDTETKAYWLGFLLADGCIAKSAGTRRAVRVFLKRSDAGHLRKLAKFFNYRGKLYSDERDHPRVGIVFNSANICQPLLDRGWLEYKRHGNTRIVESIPDYLFNHFFRGYFDGDGCISYHKRNLRNNKDWQVTIVCKHRAPLELFAERLAPIWRSIKQPHPRNSVYTLVYNGNNKLLNLIEWMYKDATVYLDRKMFRRREFEGAEVYEFRNIWDFSFHVTTTELCARGDSKELVDEFTNILIDSGWCNPKADVDDDYSKCQNIQVDKYIAGQSIKNGQTPGNKIIEVYQPKLWHVAQKGSPAIADFVGHRSLTRRAVAALMTGRNRRIYPRRLIREMLFAGFSRASMTSIPVLMAAIRLFDLRGMWFDPCAGWGHRLLAAHLLGYDYEGTDPGVSYNGLVKLKEDFGLTAAIHNLKWQDLGSRRYDFVMTSPPFWNKEDYLDGVDYGDFDDWYRDFIVGLIHNTRGRLVLHVDRPIKDKIVGDFQTRIIELYSVGRSKAPTEFFVEVLR